MMNQMTDGGARFLRLGSSVIVQFVKVLFLGCFDCIFLASTLYDAFPQRPQALPAV